MTSQHQESIFNKVCDKIAHPKDSFRFRYGLIGMLLMLVVFGLLFRLMAPRWQFERFLDGKRDVALRQFMITSGRRAAICRDPEVLAYLTKALPGAPRAGEPEGPYSPQYSFTCHFTLGSGTYVIENSLLSQRGLALCIPFEPKLLEYGWPNRCLTFDHDAPPNWQRIVDFLVEEDNFHQTLTCDERGEISIAEHEL